MIKTINLTAMDLLSEEYLPLDFNKLVRLKNCKICNEDKGGYLSFIYFRTDKSKITITIRESGKVFLFGLRTLDEGELYLNKIKTEIKRLT
jgi:TATA-box binding protein (TBP) (component of TFIID and TFIIIB)